MSTEVVIRSLTICNKRGLHARASAKFVKCVESFDADITVSKNNQSVPGCSIMGLMMLGASTGCIVDISASGPEANAAVDALDMLVADMFGEGE